jgi:uncharacterized protein with HEPN domain
MAKRSARERLNDIAESIDKIGRFLRGKAFEDFKTDALIHDAGVRNLEIVSEASRHVPANLKTKAAHIPCLMILPISAISSGMAMKA